MCVSDRTVRASARKCCTAAVDDTIAEFVETKVAEFKDAATRKDGLCHACASCGFDRVGPVVQDAKGSPPKSVAKLQQGIDSLMPFVSWQACWTVGAAPEPGCCSLMRGHVHVCVSPRMS